MSLRHSADCYQITATQQTVHYGKASLVSLICQTVRQCTHSSGKTTHQHILVVSLLPGSGFGGREIPAVIVALVIIIIITITIIIIMIIT